jgi:site-specific DNA-methyltransferase (adenine-specific)
MIDQRIYCLSALDLDPADVDVDVMICDPPYSRHVHSNAVSQSAKRGARIRDLGFEALSPALRRQIGRFSARVRRWSLIYSDVESAAWIRMACQAAGTEYVRTLPWVRWSMPQISGDRPPAGLELVTLVHPPGRKHWSGLGSLTHLSHTALRGEGKHKAEKPIDQALDLVSWFTEPGETVFDPCAGRGTVGVACAVLGRGYVGLEIDPAEHARAEARLDQAKVERFSLRDFKRIESWLQERPAFEAERARIKAINEKAKAANARAKAAE